jgi:hypothetical protein
MVGIRVLPGSTIGNMYHLHGIIKRNVWGSLCVDMDETLISKECRVENEKGLGGLPWKMLLQLNWLGPDQGEEFGSSYGKRLKFLRTTGRHSERRSNTPG